MFDLRSYLNKAAKLDPAKADPAKLGPVSWFASPEF